jgi:CRP-like cAMP-binding protein
LTDQTDTTALLASTEIFRTLDPESLAALAAGTRERRLRAGEEVVRQGERGSSLFIIQQGLLEVRVEAGGISPKVAPYLRPGDFFGEMALLTGAPRSATVSAVTDSIVCELEKSVLTPVLQRRPTLTQELARKVSEHRLATQQVLGAADLERRIDSHHGLPINRP